MSGEHTTVAELHKVFRPEADGGILDRAGVVDFATGRGSRSGRRCTAAAERPNASPVVTQRNGDLVLEGHRHDWVVGSLHRGVVRIAPGLSIPSLLICGMPPNAPGQPSSRG